MTSYYAEFAWQEDDPAPIDLDRHTPAEFLGIVGKPWDGATCTWTDCALPFTGLLYGSPLCHLHAEMHRSPEQDRRIANAT